MPKKTPRQELRDFIVYRLLAGDRYLREAEDPETEAKKKIDEMSNWDLLDYVDDFLLVKGL